MLTEQNREIFCEGALASGYFNVVVLVELVKKVNSIFFVTHTHTLWMLIFNTQGLMQILFRKRVRVLFFHLFIYFLSVLSFLIACLKREHEFCCKISSSDFLILFVLYVWMQLITMNRSWNLQFVWYFLQFILLHYTS